MKISKSNLEKIIAEELRLVLAESKAEKAKKMGTSISQAAAKKSKNVSAKVTSNAKRKKFKSKKEAQEWTATQILKSVYPGHTLTGTAGLAAARQKLQDKIVQNLYGQRIPKGKMQFVKRAVGKLGGKLFSAYAIAELANYAIKGNWQKFQETLAINAGFLIGIKVIAATGGLALIPAAMAAYVYFFGSGDQDVDIQGGPDDSDAGSFIRSEYPGADVPDDFDDE